jgi:hypothetical protein
MSPPAIRPPIVRAPTWTPRSARAAAVEHPRQDGRDHRRQRHQQQFDRLQQGLRAGLGQGQDAVPPGRGRAEVDRIDRAQIPVDLGENRGRRGRFGGAFQLDGLRAAAAHPVPTPPLAEDQVAALTHGPAAVTPARSPG